ncbi:MAG: hypothetical protein M3Q58_04960 [Bacteroidota bacterium]|nr:hypothetical protein [Bacteroidota bacterium]
MKFFFSMALPILPGKTEKWKQFINELNGPRYKEYQDSRKKANIHENIFFQSTLFGDLAIFTIEGINPEEAFMQSGLGNDPFTQWFSMQIEDIHGVDITDSIEIPTAELVTDSEMKKTTTHPH